MRHLSCVTEYAAVGHCSGEQPVCSSEGAVTNGPLRGPDCGRSWRGERVSGVAAGPVAGNAGGVAEPLQLLHARCHAHARRYLEAARKARVRQRQPCTPRTALHRRSLCDRAAAVGQRASLKLRGAAAHPRWTLRTDRRAVPRLARDSRAESPPPVLARQGHPSSPTSLSLAKCDWTTTARTRSGPLFWAGRGSYSAKRSKVQSPAPTCIPWSRRQRPMASSHTLT